ncbi:DNA-binding GntR family transcriptional regulator [Angulomicrobium tetraedrale]|uniref:DNA-binding GntR family transcriptional regulator n=1 Tax=Ancylobacter tetraedralis TaxID=217068 RepID=A0A839ZDH0_9HYPH|nr:DNA-binding GntR family transcriptional regulator [Ancylobacter tetraedralis]
MSRITFQSMHEQVYTQITDVLMRGGFAPGQKVSSRKLAAALGTSDMPVRAALGRLLAEGGLVQNANGTYAVPSVDPVRFRDVMELRALLEGRAAEQAAGCIDAAGLRELEDCGAELDAAFAENDTQRYLDINQRLKFTIYRYTPSQTLKAHIRLLWLQAGPFLRHLNGRLPQMLDANFHDEAIAALKAGDGPRAGAAIARVILAGTHFLLAHVSFAEDDTAP